ncbi:unnamed protein product [Lampetra planeri]
MWMMMMMKAVVWMVMMMMKAVMGMVMMMMKAVMWMVMMMMKAVVWMVMMMMKAVMGMVMVLLSDDGRGGDGDDGNVDEGRGMEGDDVVNSQQRSFGGFEDNRPFLHDKQEPYSVSALVIQRAWRALVSRRDAALDSPSPCSSSSSSSHKLLLLSSSISMSTVSGGTTPVSPPPPHLLSLSMSRSVQAAIVRSDGATPRG